MARRTGRSFAGLKRSTALPWLRPASVLRRGGASLFVPHFYVDSASGSDSNDGSAANPYQTLAKAATEAASIGNGVRIGLVAGSTWREELDLSALDNADIRGVGDLAGNGLPVIDGADVFAGTWVTSAGRADGNTNVYSTGVTQAISDRGHFSVWEDGVKLTWVSSLANCQSTAGSFYVTNPGGGDNSTADGAQTIYVHPTGSTNANSDGKTYEFQAPDRGHCVVLGDGAKLKYVHCRRPLALYGCVTYAGDGVGPLVEGCILAEATKHEALMYHGTYKRCFGYHPKADSRTIAIGIEFYRPDGTGYSCTYEDCTYLGPGINNGQAVTAFGGHNSGAGTFYDGVTASGLSVQGCGTALKQDGTPLTVSRMLAKDCELGIDLTSETHSLTDLWYDMQASANNPCWGLIRGPTAATAFPVTVDGARVYFGAGHTSTNLVFTCYDDVTLTGSAIVYAGTDNYCSLFQNASTVSGRTLSLRSSIFQVNTNNLTIFSWTPAGAQVLGTRDNNAYFDNSSGIIEYRVDGTLYTSPGTYLAAHPETGTITTNPGLVDPAGGDFSLSSPLANGAGCARFPTFHSVPQDIFFGTYFVLSLEYVAPTYTPLGTLEVSDPFDTTLTQIEDSGNWTRVDGSNCRVGSVEPPGVCFIQSTLSTPQGANYRYNTALSGGNHWSAMRVKDFVTTGGAEYALLGPAVRASTETNIGCYVMYVVDPNTTATVNGAGEPQWQISRLVNGASTGIINTAGDWVNFSDGALGRALLEDDWVAISADGSTIKVWVWNSITGMWVELDSVTDTTHPATRLHAGMCGFSTGSNEQARFSDWQAGLMLPAAPLFSDDINRPDELLEGSPNWNKFSGTGAHGVVSNQLSTDGTTRLAYYDVDASAASPGADQYAEVELVQFGGTGHKIILFLRFTGSSAYYRCHFQGDGEVRFQNVNTIISTTSAAFTPTAGQVLRFEVEGTTLRAKVNGSVVATATSSAQSSGRVGLGFAPNTTGITIVDNFALGNI